MLDARFGSLLRRVNLTLDRDELLEEAARRCNDVVSKHAQRFHALIVDLIAVEVAAGRITLSRDVTADSMASAFATVARGVNIDQPPPSLANLRELYLQHVRLVLHGSIMRSV